MVVIATAKVSKRVSLDENARFQTDETWWNMVCDSMKLWRVFVLTFVRVASLDVSGDADHSQRVDADETKEQREEAIYLEEDRTRGPLIHNILIIKVPSSVLNMFGH